MRFQTLPQCGSSAMAEAGISAAPIKLMVTPRPSIGAQQSIVVTSSSPGLIIDADKLQLTNAVDVTIKQSDVGIIISFRAADPSKPAAVTVPTSAYSDAFGNVGLSEVTVDVPAAPGVGDVAADEPTAAGKVAGGTAAAVGAAAVANVIAGGAGGGNIGRAVTNLQFYAWSSGLAAPHIPRSYWNLTRALRWAAVVSAPGSQTAASTPVVTATPASEASSNEGVPARRLLDAARADVFGGRPALPTEADLLQTFKMFGVGFAAIAAAHAGAAASAVSLTRVTPAAAAVAQPTCLYCLTACRGWYSLPVAWRLNR